MSILFMDGFDHYGTTKEMSQGMWTSSDIFSTFAGGRFSGNSLYLGSDGAFREVRKNFPNGPESSILIGFALRQQYSLGSEDYVRFGDYSHLQLSLSITPQGELRFRNGDDQIIGTSTSNIVLNTWYYMEMKITFHETAGSVVLHVNGEEWINAASQDTVNDLGSNQATQINLRGRYTYYDDFYMCDLAGVNNDFFDDVTIQTTYADTDTVDTDWTRSSDTDDYLAVNESPPDDDSKYLYSSTTTDKSIFDFDNVPLTGSTINGVMVAARARKEEPELRQLYLESASLQSAAKGLCNLSYRWVWEVFETTDGATAWTEANFNAAEFGITLI